jgi:WD40 repeat protein
VTIGFNFLVHNNGANTIATISLPGDAAGQVPKIVTGGNDSTWKIWDVSQDPPAAISSYNATGIVRHVEVVDSTVLWSVDEPLTPDQSAISVGTIYMLNPDGQSTTPIRRSTFMPCTHPMGEIRDFKVENIGGSVYVLSGGGEGMIHTWRFDGANKAFEHVTSFDSHFRAVTSLLFHDNKLWTASTDQTLRIWNPATSQCERLMTCTHDAAGNASGHTEAITCLILLPPTQQQQVAHIASGGLDGNMCIWSTTGDFVHQASHDSEVMCMATFYSDPNGIPLILLGLKNGSVVARSRNSMAGIFRIDSSIARRGGINAIYDMRFFRSFVVITDDGHLISWTVAEGLRDSA